MKRLSALLLMDGNENHPAKNQPQLFIGINTRAVTWRAPMKLREIVDDVELQRFDVLKDKAKRANQELLDAQSRLKSAKAKQEMLRARMSSVPVPSNRSNPHDTI